MGGKAEGRADEAVPRTEIPHDSQDQQAAKACRLALRCNTEYSYSRQEKDIFHGYCK